MISILLSVSIISASVAGLLYCHHLKTDIKTLRKVNSEREDFFLERFRLFRYEIKELQENNDILQKLLNLKNIELSSERNKNIGVCSAFEKETISRLLKKEVMNSHPDINKDTTTENFMMIKGLYDKWRA